MVLIVLCFGVELSVRFYISVKFEQLSGRLLGKSYTLGLLYYNVFLVYVPIINLLFFHLCFLSGNFFQIELLPGH